ncbi:MAG TPA: rod-binding protein [Beijerinckiaceae bacterium]|jgi:Rod binding domain-containing protein
MAASLSALTKAHGPKPDASIASALDPAAKAKSKALKTAQDFEAMFLEQTLDRVFSSGGTEGPLGDNGTGGAVYRSMLVKEYAGQIVKSGGVGIASQIYNEMLKLQEASHAKSA